MKKIRRAITTAVATAVLLAGCQGAAVEDPAPTVVVSLYPLEFLAQEIGGDRISLTNIVPAGAEPHDFELTMQDAALLGTADLSFSLGGFQAAVDAAAAEAGTVTDLAPALDLQERNGALDPHFWLDPQRMMIAAQQIAQKLIAIDPENSDTYQTALGVVHSSLTELDAAFSSGLGTCTFDSFVTGHEAFGYLADAYGLTEIAVAGVNPDTEPSTAALAATRRQIEELGLPMVFAEPGETKIAEVLAGELGLPWGVLDPIEVVSGNEDYLSVMYANLEALREGLACR